jgi:hypothetical protein
MPDFASHCTPGRASLGLASGHFGTVANAGAARSAWYDPAGARADSLPRLSDPVSDPRYDPWMRRDDDPVNGDDQP